MGLRVASLVFALVAIFHIIRLFRHTAVTVGSHVIPMGLSWAAIVVGVAFALMPARTKKVRVKVKGAKSRGEQQKEGILGAGLALGALKLVATLLKPTITQYVAKKMSGYAAGAGPRRRA